MNVGSVFGPLCSLIKHLFYLLRSLLLRRNLILSNNLLEEKENEYVIQEVEDDEDEDDVEELNLDKILVLPSEIIEEILSRLPVKSVLRFRCVSKSWYLLLTNPHFVNLHLIHSIQRNNHLILLQGHSDLYLLENESQNRLAKRKFSFNIPIRDTAVSLLSSCKGFKRLSDHIVKLKYPTSSSSVYNSVRTLCSCHGLICVEDKRYRLWLWNPSTRKHKQLPKSLIDCQLASATGLGFGYNSISNDYEIVRIVCYNGHDRYSEVEIYSLRKNSWRQIQDIPYMLYSRKGELLHGALHWKGTRSSVCNIAIAFDIESRTFREVQLPDYERVSLCRILVTVLDGYLCMLCNYHWRIEVWAMTEYGVRESWMKLTTIDEHNYLLGVTKKGEFILQDVIGKTLSLYDPKESSKKDLVSQEIPEVLCVGTTSVVVDSLVPL